VNKIWKNISFNGSYSGSLNKAFWKISFSKLVHNFFQAILNSSKSKNFGNFPTFNSYNSKKTRSVIILKTRLKPACEDDQIFFLKCLSNLFSGFRKKIGAYFSRELLVKIEILYHTELVWLISCQLILSLHQKCFQTLEVDIFFLLFTHDDIIVLFKQPISFFGMCQIQIIPPNSSL
jgi:hypothetical protein